MTQNMKTRAGGVTAEGTFTPDELVISQQFGGKRTMVSGAGVLARGTVLGKITASGKFTTALSAAADGSQTPYCVLLEDVDASAADADAMVLLQGEVNTNKLILGAGHTTTTIFDPLRTVGINCHTGMPW